MERTKFFYSRSKPNATRYECIWKDFQCTCTCPAATLSRSGLCRHQKEVCLAEMRAWQKVKSTPWPR